MVWSKPLQEQDVLKLWDPSTLDPEPQDDYKTIACGRGDGSWPCAKGDWDVAPIDEIHAVHCCRDCDECTQPFTLLSAYSVLTTHGHVKECVYSYMAETIAEQLPFDSSKYLARLISIDSKSP